MNNLKTGQFYGNTNDILHLDGITLTDTEYTHEKVDWHFHENAYFTFIIEDKLLEGNKKDIYECKSGSLLFHKIIQSDTSRYTFRLQKVINQKAEMLIWFYFGPPHLPNSAL